MVEVPPYTVLASGDIELRQYAPSAWFCVNVPLVTYDAAVRRGFELLFRFLQQNDFDMKAPVLVMPGRHGGFDVMFYAGSDAASDETAGVHMRRLPKVLVYVKSFGGFTTNKTLLSQLRHLPNGALWASASYNSPFRLVGRHNEVWGFKDI